MHDNSINLMKKFLEQNLNKDDTYKILDIGSISVNGSYKNLMNPNWQYTGCDLEKGENVDIILDSQYNWQIENETYDIVISGQCLEHVEDTHAWMKEASRVLKTDGLICLIAPHQWNEHKYPIDCWRFLPDGIKYLFKINGIETITSIINGKDCYSIGKKIKKEKIN